MTRSQRTLLLLLPTVLALVAVAVTLGRRPTTPPAPAAAPSAATAPRERRIAVLGFHNLGTPADAWIGTALAELVQAELEDAWHVVGGTEAERARLDLRLPTLDQFGGDHLSAIARRLEVEQVLLGDYSRGGAAGAGRPVVVRYRLVEAAGAREVDAGEETGEDGALSTLARRLVDGALPSAGKAPGGADALPDREAVRLYAMALQRLEQRDALKARRLLEDAVAADPGFPLAHEALSRAWETLGFDGRAALAARRAWDLSGQLSRRRRLLVEARWHETSRNWPQAIRIWTTLHRLDPSADNGVRLAEVLTSAGRAEEARRTLAEVRALRAGPEDPRVDLAEARVAEVTGDARAQLAAASRAVATAEGRNQVLLVAEGLLRECYAYQSLGDPEHAEASCRQARTIYDGVGDRGGMARALIQLANVRRYTGDLAGARALADEALSVAREIGDQRSLGAALNRRASVDAEQGRLKEALGAYRETLDLWLAAGDRSRATTARNNVGTTLWQLGELAASSEAFDAALAEAAAIGDRRAQCFIGFNGGITRIDRGDLEGARRLCDEALGVAQALPFPSGEAMSESCLGRAAMIAGDVGAAGAHHEKALAIRRRIAETGRAAESELALAELQLLAGDAGSAASAASSLARRFREARIPHQAVAATVVAARARAATGDTAGAGALIKAAQAQARGMEHVLVRFDLELAAASIARDGTRLRALEEQARAAGVAPIALAARLARLQHAPRSDAWRRDVAQLEREAEGLAVASRARALLATSP